MALSSCYFDGDLSLVDLYKTSLVRGCSRSFFSDLVSKEKFSLVDACHLVGTEEMIRERLKAWKAAEGKDQVGSMLLRDVKQPEVLEIIADELL